jgi:TIR domain/Pentapeptide repeats (8 copies)
LVVHPLLGPFRHMANSRHVEIVKRGADSIARWRRRNPLERLDLFEAPLGGVNLGKADLRYAGLVGADLRRADLRGASLIGADLRMASMEAARLRGATLVDAKLDEAHLERADLRGAALTGATLNRVRPAGADLAKAHLAYTVIGDTDLSGVRGLDQVLHGAPSTIGLDTLFRSAHAIPKAFLSGAGVPDHVGSLLAKGRADPFHTCFISFTDADDRVASRLYADMRAAGVRCWRWKEDARWGRALTGEIDWAVRTYDKLVVILNQSSLGSEAVIREIERALQKEQRDGHEVLFPIRLDDSVFSWAHALQADVVRKVVADFRQWAKRPLYERALARLIEGLKRE